MRQGSEEVLPKGAPSDAGIQLRFALRRVAPAALLLYAILLLLGLAGCGDLTSGGIGGVDVVVVSDPIAIGSEGEAATLESGTGSTSHTIALSEPWDPTRPPPSNQLSDVVTSAEGSLRLTTRVYLRKGARGWLEVTPGLREILLSLHNGEEGIVAQSEVPAGRYDAVRVDFRFVEAEVDEGLVIQGDTVRGTIAVEVPTDGVSVFFNETVDVTDGSRTSILIQLRAQEWLRKANRVGRTVAADDFEEEIRLEIRR